MALNTENALILLLAGKLETPEQLLGWTIEEWNALVKLAKVLFVTPLLYRQLTLPSTCVLVPGEVAAQLRNAYYSCHAANAFLFHDLAAVLGGCAQAGIPVILLKGAYLAEAVYGDAGLRPMGDMDIMVHREDVLRAVKVMEAQKFVSSKDFWSEVEYSRVKHLPPFSKGSSTIELHWTILGPELPLDVDVQGLWSRAQRLHCEGQPAFCLGLEDLLLHLCIHAAMHQFYRQLRTLFDIHEVIALSGQDLDWKEIVLRAKEWNADRWVFLSLRLVQDILESNIPREVFDTLLPPDFSPEVEGWARARVFQTTPVLSDNFFAMMRPGKSRLSAFCKAMLPAPLEMERMYAIAPGSWRVILKYPVLWLDRFRRYGGSAGKMLHGDARLDGEADTQLQLKDWLMR